MKVIILAGGLGTRISEETQDKPKPMVLIGDKPILWHIMNIYSRQGYNEFVVSLGYKGDLIRNWLKSISIGEPTVETAELLNLRVLLYKGQTATVSALETGLNTQTGGRIARALDLFPNEKVMATYGDGLGNVNIRELEIQHTSNSKIATVTAVHPPARFGYLKLEGAEVTHFGEKNQSDSGRINGGFFVLEAQCRNFIHSDTDSFESDVLPRIVKAGQLGAFLHDGFWQPMDTLREKQDLEKLAQLDIPPWIESLEDNSL